MFAYTVRSQHKYTTNKHSVLIVQLVQRPLWEREVPGLIPGRVISKTTLIVPVTIQLGARRLKEQTWLLL